MGKLKYYHPHIPKELVDSIVKFVRVADFQNGSNDGPTPEASFRRPHKGGTSMYLPYNDNIGILYSLCLKCNTITEFRAVIREAWNLYEDGNKVAPILGYVTADDGKGVENEHYREQQKRDWRGYRDVVIVSRAPGHRLNDTTNHKKWYYNNSARMKGPDADYDDVVDSFWNLVHSKIRPDISGNNLMYHPVSGFNFIDFNKLRGAEEPKLRECTARFMQAFVIQKNLPNEDIKQEYKHLAMKEQQILATKLNKRGVSEADLNHGIKQIKLLDCKSIDDLFSK